MTITEMINEIIRMDPRYKALQGKLYTKHKSTIEKIYKKVKIKVNEKSICNQKTRQLVFC